MAVDQPRGLLFFIDDGLRQIFKQDFKRQSAATVIKTLANGKYTVFIRFT